SATFREPFRAQLNPHVRFTPYPRGARELASACDAITDEVGAVVLEPALGRGGNLFPAAGALASIAERCRARGALLIVDEIFTGLGRTGARWANDEATPDLLCIGKALGGGMPISACLGRGGVLRAWRDPVGEAIHTATSAGHPVACASALATLDVIEREGLAERARELGAAWLEDLSRLRRHPAVRDVRGRGLMIGIELDD